MAAHKPLNPNDIDPTTRISFVIARFNDCISEAWDSYKAPVEVSVLAKRFAKLCQYRGFRFAEMLQTLKEHGSVKFIMLTTLKRVVLPMSIWNDMGIEGQQLFLQDLENRYTKRKAKILSNPNFQRSSQPPPTFFRDLDLPKNDTVAESSTESD